MDGIEEAIVPEEDPPHLTPSLSGSACREHSVNLSRTLPARSSRLVCGLQPLPASPTRTPPTGSTRIHRDGSATSPRQHSFGLAQLPASPVGKLQIPILRQFNLAQTSAESSEGCESARVPTIEEWLHAQPEPSGLLQGGPWFPSIRGAAVGPRASSEVEDPFEDLEEEIDEEVTLHYTLRCTLHCAPIAPCPLLTSRCSLLAAHCSLHTVDCPPPTACRALLAALSRSCFSPSVAGPFVPPRASRQQTPR